MIETRFARVALVALTLAGCGEPEPMELPGTTSVRGPTGWRYERGITFVAGEGETPVVAPFLFATHPRSDSVHERETRAWLARGETWDMFAADTWTVDAAPGVWRVLPAGDLKIGAGQSGDVEWLAFRSGERRLRLDLGPAEGTWHGGDRERFRIATGALTLGAERISGYVIEEMKVSRAPGSDDSERVMDRLALVDDDGVALYLWQEREPGTGTSTSWVLPAGSERPTRSGEVEWIQVRTLEEARRDVPLHWSFSAPEAGIRGEVTALGYDAVLGAERGGRRAVEVRYTVEGWMERDGARVPVVGVVWHRQG